MTKISALPPNYARRIIDRFGGPGSLARALGQPRTTVAVWHRTGSIPQKHWQAIIDIAAPLGVLVTPWCFIADLRPAHIEEFKNAA